MMPLYDEFASIASSATQEFQSYAQMMAQEYNIPWPLFNAQIQQESGYNPNAVSSAGCIGIAQICDNVPINKWDPFASLQYMAQRMAGAYQKYGNWEDALNSYNGGDSPQGVKNGAATGYGAKILAAAGLGGASTSSSTSTPSGSGSLGTSSPALPVQWSQGVLLAIIAGALLLGAVAIASS
jgi:soluble lytic murein transglycosylase-like protein